MSKFLDFYKTSPKADFQIYNEKVYKKDRIQAFIAATLGYSLYYVCRTTLNVVKEPIIDGGILNAGELGIISSCLLFSYAIGKFVNGFLADYSNIKRFMATGLAVSTLAMILFGISIGVLICFVGGLMAVELVPRKATGSALGIVGLASYAAAGIQDIVSGQLIDKNISTLADGTQVYDFSHAAIFWIGAAVISFLLPLLNWKRRPSA